MDQNLSKITVIIPCYNEEKGIIKVIQDIPKEKLLQLGFETQILIVDNNSTDKTAQICRSLGVSVIFEEKQGKGHAIKTGFNAVSADTKYVVMLDGDNTYKAREIPRLIEPLENDFCDCVVGSRLGGKIKKNSLKFENRLANWFFTFLVRQQYRANVTDVLSGFFAWKKEVTDELRFHLVSDGFSIEMEMITKMVKLDFEVYSVPITYDVREGETKVDSLKDGLKILLTFIKNTYWSPKTITEEEPYIVYAHELEKNNEPKT
jgi:glycosyltransferase involved in cell wall biosynthesis